jgi:hypothetical protein
MENARNESMRIWRTHIAANGVENVPGEYIYAYIENAHGKSYMENVRKEYMCNFLHLHIEYAQKESMRNWRLNETQ